LTENSKEALKPFILEDLHMAGFDPASEKMQKATVIITRANFGCGSSREHAVWVFEVNGINVVIAESFARIFRQNMFNCGMLAIELKKDELEQIFGLGDELEVEIDGTNLKVKGGGKELSFSFELNPFDYDLVKAGGWLAYANQKY
jgi:3-isopropylmalate/(R)-2-methylmalate dehydratase small subunit